MAQTQKSFKRNDSVGSKCCQLKALKVLLMYLFVALLINKISRSDNRYFLFKILKNEKRKEFLTSRRVCTFELIKIKYILQKRQSQNALSKVRLNKYHT